MTVSLERYAEQEMGSQVDRRVRTRRVLRAGLAGALALALTYALFWALERTVLRGAGMDALHGLHVLRGVASSASAAVAVGWILLRDAAPLLGPPPSADARAMHETGLEISDPSHFARWFIVMRWVVIVVAAALVVIAVPIAHLLPHVVLIPLVLTVLALAGTNLVFRLLSERTNWTHRLLMFQVYSDLTLLTVLLHFSGGVENPLSLLAVFHVVIAGILLSPRQAYAVATVASALFAALAIAEATHLVRHYTLTLFPHGTHGDDHAAHHALFPGARVALLAAVLFTVCYFVTKLAQHARANERRAIALAEQAVRERQLLERALETTHTGLRVVGNGSEEWLSKQWEAWFGMPGSGRDPVGEAETKKTLEDHEVRVTEIQLEESSSASEAQEPGSSDRVLQVTTAPILDSDGEAAQMVALAQDVTEQKREQARMLRAAQLAAVGELAGQVAHEVNNPIGILSAKARLLLSGQREGMSDKTASELEKIVALADRVGAIAQGLLSYCRPSPAARRSLDVRKPIRKAIAMIESKAESRSIAIEEQLGSQNATVDANAAELEQVFVNLFLNAIDVMPEGGQLTLELRRSPGPGDHAESVEIDISDTGPGIPEAVLNRIWRPFFTTKPQGRGTGLGLSICSGLVRSHGGTIDVASKPGRGARFTVRLPLWENQGE